MTARHHFKPYMRFVFGLQSISSSNPHGTHLEFGFTRQLPKSISTKEIAEPELLRNFAGMLRAVRPSSLWQFYGSVQTRDRNLATLREDKKVLWTNGRRLFT